MRYRVYTTINITKNGNLCDLDITCSEGDILAIGLNWIKAPGYGSEVRSPFITMKCYRLQMNRFNGFFDNGFIVGKARGGSIHLNLD